MNQLPPETAPLEDLPKPLTGRFRAFRPLALIARRVADAIRFASASVSFMLVSAIFSTVWAACDQSGTVAQAQRRVEQEGGVETSTVDLPDRLSMAHRRPDVKVRYRLDVSSCAGSGGVFLYRVGAPYRLWLMDEGLTAQAPQPWLPQKGQRDALLAALGPTVHNGRVPVALALPAGVKALEVELTSLPYIPTGLVHVQIGPHQAMAAAQALSFDSLGTMSDLVAGISVFIGLVASMVSVRRRDDQGLRWFALGCVVWGARNLLYLNSDLPGDGYVAELFLSQGVSVCGLCMVASALHTCGLAGRSWRRWLTWALAFVLLGSGLGIVWQVLATPVRVVGFFLTMLTMVGCAAHLFRQTPRPGGVSLGLQALLGCAFLAQALMGGHDFGIVLGLRPPGSPALAYWGFSGLVMALALLSGSRVVAALGRAENANAELERRVAEKNNELQRSYAAARDGELMAERGHARAQERERLNREMHDGLGAQLITALRGVERGAFSKDQVANVLQEGLDELRLLMDASDLGRSLHGALMAWRNRWDARLFAIGISLRWQIDTALDEHDLGSDATLQIMRILQEATTNAVKHAQASEVHVSASLHEGSLQMDIADNGLGLSSSTPSGRGLRNMRQRSQNLRGLLSVVSPWQDGQGTCVRLRVPLAESPQSLPIPI